METAAVIYSEGQKMLANLSIIGRKAPAVLFSHGMESSKDGEKWIFLANVLNSAGVNTLRFSYRGCGEGDQVSEGDFSQTTLSRRITDFKNAMDFMINEKFSKIGVIGSSFGGMVAISARDFRMTTLITLATPCSIVRTPLDSSLLKNQYFDAGGGHYISSLPFFTDLSKYDVCHDISEYQCPVMIIHGSDDKVVNVSEAHKLYDNVTGEKKLVIIPEAGHRLNQPEQMELLGQNISEWMLKYLS